MIRNTQEEIIMLKKKIIDKCIARNMLCKEGAKLLSMHSNSFSRLKNRYAQEGIFALVPKKTGPKDNKSAPNHTPEEIEDIVIALALQFGEY